MRLSHRVMFTGMLAAEERVKNAVTPLSLRHLNTSGYGFLRMTMNAMMGLTTRAANSMQPTRMSSSLPYSLKMARPLVETAVNTRPRMPKGARLITKRTALVTASEASDRNFFVVSDAPLNMKPSTTAQNRTPR